MAAAVNRASPRPLAMFPLQSVSFPATVIPLRVFEPRYVAMIDDCLRTAEAGGEAEFGVVLIERGMEVGGGDARFEVGVLARILESQPTDDGGYHVLAVATGRLRVEVWLPDDPYPQALVSDLTDPVDAPDDAIRAAHASMRRLLARCAEAQWPAPPATIDLADDPTTLLWHLCAIAPIGPLDDYSLLRAPDGPTRLALLETMMQDVDRLVTDRLRPS